MRELAPQHGLAAAGLCVRFAMMSMREHLESLFEAERRGVGSIQEYLDDGDGEAVQTFEPNTLANSGRDS